MLRYTQPAHLPSEKPDHAEVDDHVHGTRGVVTFLHLRDEGGGDGPGHHAAGAGVKVGAREELLRSNVGVDGAFDRGESAEPEEQRARVVVPIAYLSAVITGWWNGMRWDGMGSSQNMYAFVLGTLELALNLIFIVGTCWKLTIFSLQVSGGKYMMRAFIGINEAGQDRIR